MSLNLIKVSTDVVKSDKSVNRRHPIPSDELLDRGRGRVGEVVEVRREYVLSPHLYEPFLAKSTLVLTFPG
jgi:hypothetical protein